MDVMERCEPTRCIIDAHAIFNRQGSKEHNVKEESRLHAVDLKEISSEKSFDMGKFTFGDYTD